MFITTGYRVLKAVETPLYDFAGLSGKSSSLEKSRVNFIVSGENTDYRIVENTTVVPLKTLQVQ